MAETVDAADCPEDGFGRGGGLPLEIPETGSAFDEGHKLFGGFFLAAQAPCSPFVGGVSPLGCGEGTGIVNVEDEDDDEDDGTEDEEFVLCAPLRGMNILVTSSAFIACNAPCPVSPGFH